MASDVDTVSPTPHDEPSSDGNVDNNTVEGLLPSEDTSVTRQSASATKASDPAQQEGGDAVRGSGEEAANHEEVGEHFK